MVNRGRPRFGGQGKQGLAFFRRRDQVAFHTVLEHPDFVILEGVQMGSTPLEGVKEQGKRGEQSFLDSPLGADAK